MTKHILLLLLMSIGFIQLNAQDEQPIKIKKLSEEAPKMFRQRGTMPVLKMDNPKAFEEMHNEIRKDPTLDESLYPIGYKNQELTKLLKQKKKKLKSALPDTLQWNERGPSNSGGRCRGLWLENDDPANGTIATGSVNGGLWKSDDFGQSWKNTTEGYPSLNISWLTGGIGEHSNIIYASTGEGYTGGVDSRAGTGVMKSEDGGETWSHIAYDDRMQYTHKILCDPTDVNKLWMTSYQNGAAGYLLKSEDGGVTWDEKLTLFDTLRIQIDAQIDSLFQFPIEIQDLVATPDFTEMYVTLLNFGILKSLDQGETWFPAYFANPNNVGRIEMAIAPSNSDFVYGAVQTFDIGAMLIQSKNGGMTWDTIQTENAPLANWMGAQGWYDNTIAVNPLNENEVYLGGQSLLIKVNIDDPLVVENANLTTSNTSQGLKLASLNNVNDYTALTEAQDIDYLIVMSDSLQAPLLEIKFDDAGLYFNGIIPTTLAVYDLNDPTIQYFALLQNFTDREGLEYYGEQLVTLTDIRLTDPNLIDILQDFNRLTSRITYEFSPYIPLTFEVLALRPGQQFRLSKEDEVYNNHYRPIADGYAQTADDFPEITDFRKGVHVDHHNIKLFANEDSTLTIINANDGGVAISEDGGDTFVQTGSTFKYDTRFNFETGQVDTVHIYNTSNGLNVGQFYGADKMNGANRYIGGQQDNGTFYNRQDVSESLAWDLPTFGGDGFEAVWHYENTDNIIGSAQFNILYRTQDQGENWSFIPDAYTTTGPFVSKIANSKSDPNVLFIADADGLLRSPDFGISWERINMPSAWVPNGYLNNVEISKANNAIVWAGSRARGNGSALCVSINGGFSFEAVNPFETYPMGLVTDIETHPTNERTVFATFGSAGRAKIIRSNDLGQTWEDLTGFEFVGSTSNNGFPDAAVYTVEVMPQDTNIILAGTDLGLMKSSDNGKTWQLDDSNLPKTGIWDIKIVNDEVILATHGRGLWTVSLEELQGYEPPLATIAPDIQNNDPFYSDQFEIEIIPQSDYDSILVVISGGVGQDLQTIFHTVETDVSNDLNYTVPNPAVGSDFGTLSIVAIGYKNGYQYISRHEFETIKLQGDQSTYFTDFSGADEPFALKNFHIAPINGDPALQTDHPYLEAVNSTAYLLHPIHVTSDSTVMQWDDFVSVETGYDYVYISGLNLETGEEHLLYFTDKSVVLNGEPELSNFNQILLNSFFSEGDRVLLKFELFSDPFVNDYGWAIDNLSIYDIHTAQGSAQKQPEFKANTKQVLSEAFHSYPNPMKNFTYIEYEVNDQHPIELKLYDMDGQLVQDFGADLSSDYGKHSYKLDVQNVTPGIYLLRGLLNGEIISKKWTIIE